MKTPEEYIEKVHNASNNIAIFDTNTYVFIGDAKKYIDAGISTDHECFTAEEALDKLKYGMKILIREGSAAKNFEALIGLMDEHYQMMMFCSDDKHPDSLAEGHINQLCARAVAKGIDVFKVLQAACVNPVLHYNMNIGLLKEGDAADFIVAEDLVNFKVIQTYIAGELVAERGKSLIISHSEGLLNNFDSDEKVISDFKFAVANLEENIYAIEALDGQLITNKILCKPTVQDGFYESDIANDILNQQLYEQMIANLSQIELLVIELNPLHTSYNLYLHLIVSLVHFGLTTMHLHYCSM